MGGPVAIFSVSFLYRIFLVTLVEEKLLSGRGLIMLGNALNKSWPWVSAALELDN